jgi:hypothetical protein
VKILLLGILLFKEYVFYYIRYLYLINLILGTNDIYQSVINLCGSGIYMYFGVYT